jgi:arylsulfatase A-like enzyme
VGSLDRPFPAEAGKTPIVPPEQQVNLDPSSLSLAEWLQEAGYTTAFFGKTHGVEPRGQLGPNHGFDTNMSVKSRMKLTYEGDGWKGRHIYDYLALEDTDGVWHFESPKYNPYATPYDRTYIETHLAPVANGNDPFLILRNPKHPFPKHLTDAMTDAVEDYLAEPERQEQPFFLYLSYYAVHSLFVTRPDFEFKYYGKDQKDPRHTFPVYAGMLENLDQSVGRILNALEDPNHDGDPSDSLVENTVIIFTSDNGGSDNTSNAPLRGWKGMFTEGGIRVPLTIRYPGRVEAGSAREDVVHLIDLFPTLADLSGAGLPDSAVHPLDGTSLRPLFDSGGALDREYLYYHFPGYMDNRQRPNSMVIWDQGEALYKLYFHYETQTYALFNVETDLGEEQDLLRGEVREEHQEIARKMSMELRNWLETSGAKMGTWRDSGYPVALPVVYGSPDEAHRE